VSIKSFPDYKLLLQENYMESGRDFMVTLYNQSKPEDCSYVKKQITILNQAGYFSGNVSDLLSAVSCFERFPMTGFVDWRFS
jgi:hypothetical protein